MLTSTVTNFRNDGGSPDEHECPVGDAGVADGCAGARPSALLLNPNVA